MKVIYSLYWFLYCATVHSVAAASSSFSSLSLHAMTRRRSVATSSSQEQDLETPTTSTSSSTSTTTTFRKRTACHFYIWNAPSALFYKWCHHLMQDNIIEGRGGVKFVRIEPGSVLQLLYPCSRYSPDSCVFCGGTFIDHVQLAWAKHLYTPFDTYIDWVKSKGMVVPPPPLPPPPQTSQRRRRRGGQPKYPPPRVLQQPQPQPPQHVFHRFYVQEQQTTTTTTTSSSSSVSSSLRRKPQQQQTQESSPRTFYRRVGHVVYQLPFTEVTFWRALLLTRVEQLILWEQVDNHKVAMRRQRIMNQSQLCC